ncbi:MAG: DUF177 domain-containing protein [Saccharofermentanales bacterium]
MKINVRPIIGQPGATIPLILSFEQADIDVTPDECLVIGQIRFDGELIVRDEKTIQMSGSLKAQIPGNCGRCGEPIKYDMNTVVDAVFVLKSRNAESVLYEEEDDLYYFDGKTIVPDEVLRDNLLLSIPMKMLCSDDCVI